MVEVAKLAPQGFQLGVVGSRPGGPPPGKEHQRPVAMQREENARCVLRSGVVISRSALVGEDRGDVVLKALGLRLGSGRRAAVSLGAGICAGAHPTPFEAAVAVQVDAALAGENTAGVGVFAPERAGLGDLAPIRVGLRGDVDFVVI